MQQTGEEEEEEEAGDEEEKEQAALFKTRTQTPLVGTAGCSIRTLHIEA